MGLFQRGEIKVGLIISIILLALLLLLAFAANSDRHTVTIDSIFVDEGLVDSSGSKHYNLEFCAYLLNFVSSELEVVNKELSSSLELLEDEWVAQEQETIVFLLQEEYLILQQEFLEFKAACDYLQEGTVTTTIDFVELQSDYSNVCLILHEELDSHYFNGEFSSFRYHKMSNELTAQCTV